MVHSHWQAALSQRRCSSVPRWTGGPDNASRAPCGAIVRAHWARSSSRARVTGRDVTTGAHSERSSRAPCGPAAKWVWSRSRPMVRENAAASSPVAACPRARRPADNPVPRRAHDTNVAAFKIASWAWNQP
jgi:hypothetical protein